MTDKKIQATSIMVLAQFEGNKLWVPVYRLLTGNDHKVTGFKVKVNGNEKIVNVLP